MMPALYYDSIFCIDYLSLSRVEIKSIMISPNILANVLVNSYNAGERSNAYISTLQTTKKCLFFYCSNLLADLIIFSLHLLNS